MIVLCCVFECCVFEVVGSVCLCSLLIVFKRPCISARRVILASGRTQTTAAKAAQSPLGNEKRAHHETFSNSKGSSPPGLNMFYLKEKSKKSQSQECRRRTARTMPQEHCRVHDDRRMQLC